MPPRARPPASRSRSSSEGASYPILITNFQQRGAAGRDRRAARRQTRFLPARCGQSRTAGPSAPATSPTSTSAASATRTACSRRCRIAEPNFAKKRFLTYLRLNEPLETFVNRAVHRRQVPGRERRRAYEFTEAGEAILPDRSFAYEVSLDPGPRQLRADASATGSASPRARSASASRGKAPRCSSTRSPAKSRRSSAGLHPSRCSRGSSWLTPKPLNRRGAEPQRDAEEHRVTLGNRCFGSGRRFLEALSLIFSAPLRLCGSIALVAF